MNGRRSRFVLTMMTVGYIFLYLPLVMVVFYSFNKSKLVTVWGGFSTHWYVELMHNSEIINAALLSLRIATISATAAAVLGTLAGLALTRMGNFRGRTLFTGMIAAPLVMPDVITGLSLLLLFVSLQALIGWPANRGALTIILAHTTFSMAYVAVIVQSRLSSMDEAMEEAAMDLGGRPFGVTMDITLPLIAPAIVSGWLLGFSLSLDDVVIATFVSGPGASTLPMVIFSKIRLGVTPDINAVATIIIGVVTIGVGIAGWLMLRQEKQRVRDIQASAQA